MLAANNLKAEEISFKITLTDRSGDKDILAAFDSGLPNGKVMGAIVDFNMEVIVTKTGHSIGTADKFSKAITRIIPMPGNMSGMPELWGAYHYHAATKKFEFVPATTKQVKGEPYVMINSYSNSVYVVAERAMSFEDVEQHWSRPFVRQAAAKGLVEGVSSSLFAPDKSVTRAEFTAMLVRALGGVTSAAGNTVTYDDVKSGSWYFDDIAKAKEIGLLGFVHGNSFMPDQPLTRQEMASMLAAVIKFEKLPTTQESVDLGSYKDIGSVDADLLEDVRLMVKLQIMAGTSEDTFSPKGNRRARKRRSYSLEC
ncbi:S-layer homology domain-containing protein [Paenibacillus sp. P26]|nr:S-layer homology domain-containing protein [Paenibacillus sp. P26]